MANEGSSKRRISEDGSVVLAGDSSDEDLASKLGKHIDAQNKAMAANNKILLGEITGIVEKRTQQLEKEQERAAERLDQLNGRVGELEANSNKSEAKIAELQHGQRRLQEQLRVANKNAITREDVESSVFDRPPNPEIIVVKSPKFAAKMEVENTITPWITGAGIARDLWVLSGGVSGKRFIIKFLQNPLTNADLVSTCLRALKDEEGNWKVFKVLLPNKSQATLFIGGDENSKDTTQRRMAACVKKAVSELYPSVENVHYRYRKGMVFADKIGIAKLEPENSKPEVHHFFWNLAGLEKLGIIKADVLNKTMSLLQDEDVEWSL